jgi:hypothetical protein
MSQTARSMVKSVLGWNEMRDRAFAFALEWKDEKSEKSEAQRSLVAMIVPPSPTTQP